MVGRAREVLPQSPTLLRGNLSLVGGDVSLVSLIPPVSVIGNTSAMFRGTAKIFRELVQHPSGNKGAQLGFGIGWTMLLTYPLMAAIQEISARIGRVTGHGIVGNVAATFLRR